MLGGLLSLHPLSLKLFMDSMPGSGTHTQGRARRMHPCMERMEDVHLCNLEKR